MLPRADGKAAQARTADLLSVLKPSEYGTPRQHALSYSDLSCEHNLVHQFLVHMIVHGRPVPPGVLVRACGPSQPLPGSLTGLGAPCLSLQVSPLLSDTKQKHVKLARAPGQAEQNASTLHLRISEGAVGGCRPRVLVQRSCCCGRMPDNHNS